VKFSLTVVSCCFAGGALASPPAGGLGRTAADSAPSIASVPDQAQRDQVWSMTYRAMVEELGDKWRRGLPAAVAQQVGLDIDVVSLALRYLRDYPADDLRVASVLQRYPHYSGSAVADDLARLAEAGLVQPVDAVSWRVTPRADKLVAAWEGQATRAIGRHLVDERAAHDLLRVLDRIVAAAAALETDDINASVRWRVRHRYRIGADAPVLMRIDERIWDYIAFINDNAHYRVDRYFREQGREPPRLPALAKELFAAMRDGRGFASERCASHPVWRVGQVACAEALARLQALGWAETDGAGGHRQTAAGAKLFTAIEALTDQRLYATWRTVSAEEYARYRAALRHPVRPGD